MDSSNFADTGKRVGRKKSKSKEAEKKNRPSRRGMGVAKLERAMWEENLKKMPQNYSAFQPVKLHGHSYFPPPSFPDPIPTTVPEMMFGGFTSVSHVPSPPLGPESGLFLRGFGNAGFSGQVVGSGSAGGGFSGQFQGNPYGSGAPNPGLWGGIVDESSKELTCAPNAMGGYSDRCSVCQKKKREISNIENEDLDTSKEVEVVAVRRKGMGGSGLVMEYEFFPAGGGGGRSEKVGGLGLFSEASPTSSSCVTNASAATTGGGGGGYDSWMLLSNSVDLSLKLSY